MFVVFNLAPLWYSITLINMISYSNNKLYGEVEDLERESWCFFCNSLAVRYNAARACGWYELRYLLIISFLAPLWVSIPIRYLRSGINSEIYVKVDDPEIESHWIAYLEIVMLYRCGTMHHWLAVGMGFNICLSDSVWHLCEILNTNTVKAVYIFVQIKLLGWVVKEKR